MTLIVDICVSRISVLCMGAKLGTHVLVMVMPVARSASSALDIRCGAYILDLRAPFLI